MDKKKLIDTGKLIHQLEKQIKELKKEKLKLLEQQEEKGILDLKERIELYEDFINNLLKLLKNFSIIK